MTQIVTTLEQQVLDVSKAQRVPHIQHNDHADDVGRRVEVGERIFGFTHPSWLAAKSIIQHRFDNAPDGVPVIDEMATVPGLIVAAGFSGHGFGIGPGAAHLVADLVTGQEPIIDPRPFRLSRFNSGERVDVSEF